MNSRQITKLVFHIRFVLGFALIFSACTICSALAETKQDMNLYVEITKTDVYPNQLIWTSNLLLTPQSGIQHLKYNLTDGYLPLITETTTKDLDMIRTYDDKSNIISTLLLNSTPIAGGGIRIELVLPTNSICSTEKTASNGTMKPVQTKDIILSSDPLKFYTDIKLGESKELPIFGCGHKDGIIKLSMKNFEDTSQ